MPTEITRRSAPFIAHPGARSLSPLTITAIIAFVILHLASGIMLERSHARPAVEPSASGALDDEAQCRSEGQLPEPSLPYD